jgi:two-component system chemotaxis response regulator CheY
MARILLVDDDAVTRQLLNFQLQGGNHDIHSAPSGSVALSMLGLATYDLVITDLNMPGLNGIALMEQARRQSGFSHLPFIMLTAAIGFSETMPAIAGEVAAILEKPVGVQDLLAAVDAALLRRGWLRATKVH